MSNLMIEKSQHEPSILAMTYTQSSREDHRVRSRQIIAKPDIGMLAGPLRGAY